MPKTSAAVDSLVEVSPPKKGKATNNEETILKYAPLIKYIANRIAARLPVHIDIRDMINSGVLGLMDALEKFDPDKGVKFETYAEYRIKGAILDSLRAMDWVPRSVRKVATLLENTSSELEKKHGRPATDEELAKAMNIDVDKFYKMMSRVSNIPMLSLEIDARTSILDRLVSDSSKTPYEAIDKEELRGVLANSIEMLPEKEKKVISLYYFSEITMKEIGKILDLTESRVSQIHTKAVTKLRGKLRRACYC